MSNIKMVLGSLILLGNRGKLKVYNHFFSFWTKKTCRLFEFFIVYTKLAEMALFSPNDLTTLKKLPLVGLDLILQIITGLGVQSLTK